MSQPTFENRHRKYMFVNSLTMLRAAGALTASIIAGLGDPVHAMAILAPIHLGTELDGILARKWHVTSKRGAFRDYVADAASFSTGAYILSRLMDYPTSSDFDTVGKGLMIIGMMVLIQVMGIDAAYRASSHPSDLNT